MKNIITLFALCFSLSLFAAPKGYDIKVNIKSLANQKILLAFYYGDNKYIKDTFEFDKNGVCTIKADTNLPTGIYLAVFPTLGNRYFEFIINEPRFELTTDTTDLAGKMVIKNSLENKLFYEDMLFLNDKRKESEIFNTQYKNAVDEKAKNAALDKLKNIDKEVKAKRETVIATNPATFYAQILRAMKENDIPEPPRDASGKIIDSAFQWRYYKDHYWNNFDFSNDNLLRTPIFHNKLQPFYTRTLVQQADSLILEGDKLLSKMNPKSDLYKYTLIYMLNEMAKAKIMGLDAVYAHLALDYYAKGKAPWVDTVQLFKIKDNAVRMLPTLIGKKAQQIVLADTSSAKYFSLYSMKNKYIILAFYDPDCGHCKKEMPKMYAGYKNLKKMGIDVGLFSVAAASREEMKKWKDFIRDFGMDDCINVGDPDHQNNYRYEWNIQSNPQIYILDANKIIIGKRMGGDQVEDFIHHEADPSFRPARPAMMEGDETKPHE